MALSAYARQDHAARIEIAQDMVRDGKSVKEISKALGRSESTVRGYLVRAKRNLAR